MGSADSDVAETCDEAEDVPDVSEGLEKPWFGGREGGGEWTATVTTCATGWHAAPPVGRQGEMRVKAV